jgi:ribose transport system substrate-binding protein
MDEETTECAYQAMIDYNLAGQVKIIGYYTSKTVMEALEKGLIPSTCAIDTGSLGRYSVEALVEYINEGRVNVYHNVDLHFVTADMLSKDGEQESDEEIQMEKSVSGK